MGTFLAIMATVAALSSHRHVVVYHHHYAQARHHVAQTHGSAPGANNQYVQNFRRELQSH
jgi:hypothetical protein